MRGKPDETLVQRNPGLQVPTSDQLVLPGQLSEGSITRSHQYQVTKVLYGSDIADQQAYRKLESYQPGALPPTEQQLLQIAGADRRGVVIPQNTDVRMGSAAGPNRNWRFGDPIIGPGGLILTGVGR